MADPTLIDSISFLSPLVGAGGFTAIVVAYLGSKRPKTADRPEGATIGISALLGDSASINRIAEELRRLTDAVEEVARAGHRHADLMDISRAVERLREK